MFIENVVRNGLQNINITGTRFEYSMQYGKLNEDIPVHLNNPYGIAKKRTYKIHGKLGNQYVFALKWTRLFYMYGKGQSTKSLLSQLQQTIDNNDEIFNMNGGEQTRDYLPVERVAEYIVNIAIQTGNLNKKLLQRYTYNY